MSARTIRDEVLVADHPVLQQRVAYVLPIVPDGAPYAVAEGLARRRVTAMTGRCPCGTVVDYGAVRAGAVEHVEVVHAGSCPAATARLVKACRRWLR